MIGTAAAGESMVALAGDGKVIWTLDFPAGTQHCESLAVSPDGAWAAAGLRGGRVCVVDIAQGRIVAQVSGQGMRPETGWVARDGKATPLLLVATGRELAAFRVVPAPATKEDRHALEAPPGVLRGSIGPVIPRPQGSRSSVIRRMALVT